jgi:hypothetical protein
MKKFFARAVAAAIVCTLTGAVALADGKSSKIKVSEDFQLNGTSVKKGTYEVSFDEQTGELSLKRDRKVVAKAKARAEQTGTKSRNTTFTIGDENGGRVLRSVTFSGDKQTVIVGEGGAATAGAN